MNECVGRLYRTTCSQRIGGERPESKVVVVVVVVHSSLLVYI
jgi:hypothetical protein